MVKNSYWLNRVIPLVSSSVFIAAFMVYQININPKLCLVTAVIRGAEISLMQQQEQLFFPPGILILGKPDFGFIRIKIKK